MISSARNVDVLFLIEHEDREGGVVNRMQEELNKYGVSSAKMSINFHLHLLTKVRTKLIVVPYAISSSEGLTALIYTNKSVRTGKIKVLSLNWEQYLSKANYAFKKPQDSIIKNMVYHVAWDQNYKLFLENNGVKESNIKITGNPSHQVLVDLTCNYTVSQVKQKIGLPRNFKKTIFLPMNYGWAFMSDEVINYKVSRGYQRDVALTYRDYTRSCIRSFCHFIDDASSTDVDTLFVIRPHPSISVEQYYDVFEKEAPGVKDRNNVIVSKDFSIREWIFVSDYVGSSWSTSIIDAIILDKEVFLYTPEKRPEFLDVEWNNLVPNISSYSDIKNIKGNQLEKMLVKKDVYKNLFDFINEIIQDSDLSDFKFEISKFNLVVYSKTYIKSFLMKIFSGYGVDKGQQRDYFDENNCFQEK